MDNIPKPPDIKDILEGFIRDEESRKVSTYDKAHKKYYRRNRKLIQVRQKEYQRQYKARWYKQNRERILAELKVKRAVKQLELDLGPEIPKSDQI